MLNMLGGRVKLWSFSEVPLPMLSSFTSFRYLPGGMELSLKFRLQRKSQTINYNNQCKTKSWPQVSSSNAKKALFFFKNHLKAQIKKMLSHQSLK